MTSPPSLPERWNGSKQQNAPKASIYAALWGVCFLCEFNMSTKAKLKCFFASGKLV